MSHYQECLEIIETVQTPILEIYRRLNSLLNQADGIGYLNWDGVSLKSDLAEIAREIRALQREAKTTCKILNDFLLQANLKPSERLQLQAIWNNSTARAKEFQSLLRDIRNTLIKNNIFALLAFAWDEILELVKGLVNTMATFAITVSQKAIEAGKSLYLKEPSFGD